MNAAMVLACAVLQTQGWELRDLSEAGLSLSLPAAPVLATTGSTTETPQSVERYMWRADGMGVMVTVIYDRWRTPHFAPSESLDILARRTLGLLQGYTIQPAQLGGLPASLLLVDRGKGVEAAILRAKSGLESWQVELRPTSGVLRQETIDGIQASVQVAAQAEDPGAYDAWGNVMARLEPAPAPRPAHSAATELKSALMAVASPVELKEMRSRPSDAERGSVDALAEWAGKDAAIQVTATYFRLREGQAVDIGAWVAAYGERLKAEGFDRFEPQIEQLKLEGAEGRVVRGSGAIGGRKLDLQIILAVRGREAWAVQSRMSAALKPDPLQAALKTSFRLLSADQAKPAAKTGTPVLPAASGM